MNNKKDLNEIPIISIEKLHQNDVNECKKVVESFHNFGIIIVRDNRVSEEDNANFIDLMETYFEQEEEQKLKDTRPQLHYQIGTTPAFTEKPKNHCDKIIPGIDRPVTQCPPSKDAKWRFFWRIGERPKKTEFPELNAKAVIPEQFYNVWEDCMNTWGNKLHQSVKDISQALAIGLDLPNNTFLRRMHLGPHLLAPTGTNLQKFGTINTTMAGYHYDLNFITCHGKSRYPGLFIWLKNGKRVPVKIPNGCLLMQAGMQLEWITGGYIKAGYHEVVVSEDTQKKIVKNRNENKSLWRVSSTFFSHLNSDIWLEPLFNKNNLNENEKKKYPKVKVGEQVQQELASIKLKL